MKQRYIIVLAVVFVAAAIVVGGSMRNHMAYVRDLEEFHVREMQQWVIMQRGFAYKLDVALAEVLTATDDARDKALSEANNIAWQGRDALFRPSLLSTVNQAVDRWGYAPVYEKAGGYLYYLKESGRPLGGDGG